MSRIGRHVVLLVLLAATVGCDRVTKRYAATTLAGTSGRSFLADTIRLEYTENTGAFLGLGAEWPAGVRTALFTVGNAIILFAALVLIVRLRWTGWAFIGAGLFVAGGASNLVDRLARGSVIDFMNVGVGPVRTGIFNVADVGIVLGAALILLTEVRSRDDTPP
jgi:signal peptidase II